MVRRKYGYAVAGLALLCTGFAAAMEVVPSAKQVTGAPAAVTAKNANVPHQDGGTGNDAPNGATTAAGTPAAGAGGIALTAMRAPAGGQSPLANSGGVQAPPGTYRDDPCADAIVSTGPINGVNGLLSERNTSDGTFDSYSADDVTIGNDTLVGGIVSYHLTRSGSGWDGTLDYEILDGSSGAPDDNNIVSSGNVAGCGLDTGQQEFGIEVIQYTIYPNVTIPAGTWYTALRPVVTSSFSNYWATSDPSGQQGYFQSAFFTGGVWQPASSQLGQDQNFSYCWVSPFNGGACCNNGDCAELTQKDCANSGGTYQGDGVPCCAVICPGSPQACCMPDFTCQLLKPGDCSNAGGISLGDGTKCAPNPCASLVCQDALYDNGAPDNNNGLTSERDKVISSYTAADVTFGGEVTVTDMHYYSQTLPGDVYGWAGTSDLILVDDGGGFPNNTITEIKNYPSTRIDLGYTLFGLEVYLYTVDGLNLDLAPATYWFGVRPVGTTSNFGRAFWLTAPLTGADPYIKSAFFGFPDWTDWAVLGIANEDVAFCLTGHTGPTDLGGCCFAGGACSLLTKSDCANQGGTFQGLGTFCFPDTCPGAPGACCNPDDGTCQFISRDDCNAQGGNYLGEGTSCDPGVCPLPDPCDGTHGNVVYNNSVYDGVNGLFNSRSTDGSGFIDAEIVDDVFFVDQNTTLQSLHWYDVKDGGYAYTGTSDWYLWDTTGPGGSPGNVIYGGESIGAPSIELDTGLILFGRSIWQNNINGIGQPVAPGVYWVGMRPNQSFFAGAAYWLTAPLTGNEGWFKSAIFGVPNFQPVSKQLGVAEDFAFCVVGDVTGVNTGACCNNGDCSQLSASDCKNSGGTYSGDGTTCFPNSCPGAPGACCFPDGTCQMLKPDDCSGQGGNFQGSGQFCTPGLCPLPDPCDGSHGNVVYNNSAWDSVNGLFNTRSTDGSGVIDAEIVDDVSFCNSDTTLQSLHWYDLKSGYSYAGTSDWYLWDATGPGNGPGNVVYGGETIGAPSFELDTGLQIFGLELWQNNIDGIGQSVASGFYWIGMRPNQTSYTGPAYWATAPRVGAEGWFKSAIFGVPNFAPVSTQLGTDQEDFAFCVVGDLNGSNTGACCNNGDCSQLTQSDCSKSGGSYLGDCTSCVPNTCPGAPGACCFPDGSCQSLKEGPCGDQGGSFQGSGSACAPGLCPIPNPCSDAVFDESAWDGANGFANQRDDGIGLLAVNVSDINLASTTTLSSVHWYEVDDAGITVPTDFDFYQLNDDGNCEPDQASESITNLPLDSRLDTGLILFGRHIWQYNGSVSTTLNGGQNYFLGMVPHTGSPFGGQAFILSAPKVGCSSYFKSAFFGVPNYITETQEFGLDDDTAWCAVAGGGNPCAGIVLGDSNGDGSVDFNDIDCFVAALISQAAWDACGTAYPDSAYLCANDVNKDNSVDFNDIDTFVQCIINSGCP